MSDAVKVDPYENYDLKAQAEAARDPSVRFAFEFPALLNTFREADAEANAAKKLSRRLGFISVALVLAALATATAAPLLKSLGKETVTLLAYASAVLGLVGTALGLAGMRKTSSRRKWLQSRLSTEVLRLFHFRFIASRLPEIAAIGEDEAKRAAYLEARAATFEDLRRRVLTDPERELARIAAEHDLPDFDVGVEEIRLTGAENPAVLNRVFDVWRELRLNWQLGYCNAKLKHHATSGRMSSRQVEELFSGIGWTAIAIVIALHVALLAADQLKISMLWIEVLVVWTALAALAARALEDGLQPQRDVERYEQYRANILVTLERLDRASDAAAKLETIRAFERVSLEEMRVFMRTHAKSRFLL